VTYEVGSQASGAGRPEANPARVTLPTGVTPDGVRLVDALSSNEVPFQFWRDATRMSFYASLPKGGNYRYELQPGRPAAHGQPPAITQTADALVLENSQVAIRLLPLGEVTFREPRALGRDTNTQAVAPGPFQGVRLSDGRWVGGSFFYAAKLDSAPKVAGYECRITEQGPLFVEATVRYTFNNGGWYRFTARVLAGDAAVRIDEQFDTGAPGSMWDWRLMVSLGAGWKPDTLVWLSPNATTSYAAFTARLAALGLTNQTFSCLLRRAG